MQKETAGKYNRKPNYKNLAYITFFGVTNGRSWTYKATIHRACDLIRYITEAGGNIVRYPF